MAQNITLLGASYPDVPAVVLPKTGGGTATFYDIQQKVLCGTAVPSSSVGNNGDIYIVLSGDGEVEVYPADYTSANMNSSSGLSACIGVSAEEGTSTSNVYSSGQNTTGTADYTFDLSGIPANAVISSVSCVVKAHEENASRSTCTLQLYSGSTAKGSATTVSGTSNAIYTLTTGSWTRSELDNLKLRMSVGYYGGLIAGATLTIVYELENPSFELNLSGDSNGWAISGNNIYKKQNGTWTSVTEISLESAISKE